LADKKYCVIFDAQGAAATFFTYQATVFEFAQKSIGVIAGKQTKDEMMNDLRKAIVGSMKHGKIQVINIDKLSPNFFVDWTQQDEKDFNSNFIFNFARFEQEYMKIVREEENQD
jgi:hypothetical protein